MTPAAPDPSPAGPSAATGRRELTLAILVLLAGAGLAFWSFSAVWVRAQAVESGLPPIQLAVTGRDLHPAAAATCLVALVAALALLATRRTGRRVVGLVVVVAGVAIAWAGIDGLRDPAAGVLVAADASGALVGVASSAWPVLALVGGVLVVLAGGATVLRAGRWPAMGARYERPAAKAATTADTWAALDRGEDPTRD